MFKKANKPEAGLIKKGLKLTARAGYFVNNVSRKVSSSIQKSW